MIDCSVVRLASEADSQKVMSTTPLWLASALRLQLGSLVAAPAGAAPDATTAAVVVAVADAMKRVARVSLERRAIRMSIA